MTSSPLETGAADRTEVAGLAALRSGTRGRSPVLLVPGFTGSKEDFGPILDPIAAAGYDAVAIDLPGQFESPPLPAGVDYRPDSLATAVLAVAAELSAGAGGQPVRLVGHSYGGLVARAAVIADPSAFASVVLLCSGPAQIGDERRAILELLAPVLEASGVDGVYEASLAVEAGEPDYVAPTPELAAFFRRRFLAGSATMLLGMSEALRTEPDRVAELRESAVPAAVIHGVDDVPWPPAWQADMAQRLAAHYVVIDAAAHSPAVENPTDTVRALLEFWARSTVG